MIGLSNPEAARLVLSHAGDAIAVFSTTLKDNLLAGSNFILPEANRHLNSVIVWTNRAYALMLVALIPLAAAALWRARDGRLALLCVATLNVFLSGGLSFYQGDRLTVIALPLWTIAGLFAPKRSSPSMQVTDIKPGNGTCSLGQDALPETAGSRRRARKNP